MEIVLIGSGNVATHLGKALKGAGHQIKQVYSRELANARSLALPLDADPIAALEAVDLDADLYVICVTDRAIGEVIGQLPSTLKGIVVHTSGSTALDVFSQTEFAYGVLYPLQTFSKVKSVDFKQIPIAVEGQSAAIEGKLIEIAEGLTDRSFSCDSKQRLALHVSAVFACNFANFLYSVSETILQENKLSYDLIKPLIWETAQKAMVFSPKEVQTGPAVRADHLIMSKHHDFLKENAELAALYEEMSRLIMKRK